jgi:hypothetical protein
MYELPTSVIVEDKEFKIREAGDFRVVLDCFSALGDIDMGENYRVLASLIIFYEDFDEDTIAECSEQELVSLVKEMYKFFNCGKEETSKTNNLKLIDWDTDSQMIISAINNVAGKEIRLEPYVHWWTFLGYYMSIGESVLATVVSIRNKILKGEKLEKWEQKFRHENPDMFKWNSKTVDEQELDDLVHELWNSGKDI